MHLLIPKKLVDSMKKKKHCKGVDPKLMKIVDIVDPQLTQIGTKNDMCFTINATIASTPNDAILLPSLVLR